MGSAETDHLPFLSRLASLFSTDSRTKLSKFVCLENQKTKGVDSCFERVASNKIPHNFREIEKEKLKDSREQKRDRSS